MPQRNRPVLSEPIKTTKLIVGDTHTHTQRKGEGEGEGEAEGGEREEEGGREGECGLHEI